jgi:hypothetical protein
MVVECRNVSEVVRVLRWAGGRVAAPELRIVINKDNANSGDRFLQARTFIDAVRKKNEE